MCRLMGNKYLSTPRIFFKLFGSAFFTLWTLMNELLITQTFKNNSESETLETFLNLVQASRNRT